MENKLFDNNFDEVEYGQERTKGSSIAISPFVSDQYEESTTENMEDIYTRKKIMEKMATIYDESPYPKKYGTAPKKVERADLAEVYYYFKDELVKDDEYTLVQIFCAIAEFFDLNYRTMYNDIISLTDKAQILEQLSEQFGLQREFSESKKLF